MPGSFFGLEIAKLALWANQRAMDVTAHNIANANSPGYSRQRAHLRPAAPLSIPVSGTLTGQMGSGVVVARILSTRSAFLDRQIWSGTAEQQRWAAHRQALERIEAIINEPTENGIRGALDRWWEALAVLAANPESMAARTSVLERSKTLITTFQDVDRRLRALEDDLKAELSHRVDQVNALARRIDELNKRIIAVEASGQAANDLRDQRALAVEELAGHVGVGITESDRGVLRVTLDGVDLVGEHGYRTLEVGTDPVTGEPAVLWTGLGKSAAAGSGAIGGILELIQSTGPVPRYRAELLDFARTLATEVNRFHRADTSGTPVRYTYTLDGAAGGDFFNVPVTTLDEWSLAITDPREIAAGVVIDPPTLPPASLPPGDGSNAQAINDLKFAPLVGGATLDDAYRSWVSRLGVATAESARRAEHQELLLTQVSNQRQQLAGVSLDEEMAAMLQYQHAYNAAARVITAVDQMLETLIHRTGIAGR
ncbi:MAG TPA: flagellar hook-associated protein FlgK [Bacillota bacterium]